MAGSFKVGVTGAAGMLGAAILDRLSGECKVFANSREVGYQKQGVHWQPFDLLDKASLVGWLTETHPEAVVHCAAMVNVDVCEREPARAKDLHAGTTGIIGDTISNWGGRLIYISTDSVFNGCKNGLYNEDDEPDPRNVYARTKREGEVATLATQGGTVLRTNIFGWSQAERVSFAEWVLQGLVEGTPLVMFTDVRYTPIHVSHLAEMIARVLFSDLRGLFHATGSRGLSKYEFAICMAAMFGLSTLKVKGGRLDETDLEARRPKNMALLNSKLCTALGYTIPGVDAGISLMKEQYDSGWVAQIKGRSVAPGYRFWEAR